VSKDQKEEAQKQRINARLPRDLAVCRNIFPFQQLEIDGQHLDRVYNRKQGCKRANKQ
jgi:hypothetical protein